MRLLSMLALVISVALAVACSDAPTTPDTSAATVTESDMVSFLGGAMYYRCTLLRPDGEPRMQLRALKIGQLGMEEAPGRKRTSYTLRSVSPGGELISRLNCWIPATREAVDAMHAMFGVQVFTIQSPCDTGDPTVCYPDGVDVTVPPPECDPYEELDFSCDDDPCTEAEVAGSLDMTVRAYGCEGGGGDGGGTTDPGGGGGSGSDDGPPSPMAETCQVALGGGTPSYESAGFCDPEVFFVRALALKGCPESSEGWVNLGPQGPVYYDVERQSPIRFWHWNAGLPWGQNIAYYTGSVIIGGIAKPLSHGVVFCGIGLGIFQYPL